MFVIAIERTTELAMTIMTMMIRTMLKMNFSVRGVLVLFTDCVKLLEIRT